MPWNIFKALTRRRVAQGHAETGKEKQASKQNKTKKHSCRVYPEQYATISRRRVRSRQRAIKAQEEVRRRRPLTALDSNPRIECYKRAILNKQTSVRLFIMPSGRAMIVLLDFKVGVKLCPFAKRVGIFDDESQRNRLVGGVATPSSRRCPPLSASKQPGR